MRGRKWSVLAGLGMIWGGCNKAVEPYEFQVLHVGGMPYANQPLIPFSSDSVSSGWWHHDGATTLGDTVWSDADGRVTIDRPEGHWDGVICLLLASQETPRAYTVRFPADLTSASARTFAVPGVAFIRFVGNRNGIVRQQGFWLFHSWETPSNRPERWITPGRPPSPSLLLPHWIHPDEPMPIFRRYYALRTNGNIDELPALYIHKDMIGDTTRHPVFH